MHHALTSCADTTGVDYSREAVESLRSSHIFDNVLHGDAEHLEELGLKPEFDVVVAGNIIEHLSNPGRMLDGIRSVCRDDTRVVVTTNHAFGLLAFVRYLGDRYVEGREHVFTMNAQHMHNLAARHGFEVVELDTCYEDHATHSRLFKVGRAFFEAFPKFGGTLFAVLRPRNSQVLLR